MTKEWAETGMHPKFMKHKGTIYHEDDFLNEFGGEDYKKALEEAKPLTEEEMDQLKHEWNQFCKVEEL